MKKKVIGSGGVGHFVAVAVTAICITIGLSKDESNGKYEHTVLFRLIRPGL